MLGTILTNKLGLPIAEVSGFQPPIEVARLTLQVKQDYEVGYQINNRPFREFNDVSLLQRMDIDQKAYLSYVQPASANPDDSWRWNGVRSMTHNKIISMAAHFVAATLYPGVFAQNDQDEEDKAAAEVMKYLMEWNIRNSDYEMSYLYAIVSALVNPVAYMQVDFTEVMQNIKVKKENGKISTEQAVDEILSGFQVYNVPAEEIFIANAYQFSLQKQRFIIRRRLIDYDEAKNRYGTHNNFQYVKLGVKALYNEGDQTFYQMTDETLNYLCEEITYYNRLEDMEVVFVNGIYMGKDNINANIMRHRDNKNRPKYPYAKFGFQPIDEKRFYFYRSAVMNLSGDQELLDKMWRMTMDGTFIKLFQPLIGIGTGKIDSNVVFPGSITTLPMGSDVKPLNIGNDLVAGMNAIGLIERSMDESSQSKVMEGQLSSEQKTAFEIGRAETNARIQLSMFGRMIAQFIREFGELSLEIIIQHETVGEAEETLGGEIKLNFRSFLLPEQSEEGKKITRKITLKSEIIGRKMTADEMLKESFRILEEEEEDKKIYEVNPDYIQKLKYKILISAESLEPKSEEAQKLAAKADYQFMRGDPLFNQKQVAQDLAEALKGGESDKYMLKDEEMQTIPPISGLAQKGQAPESRSLEGLLKV